MTKFLDWFKKFFSAETAESSKRLAFIVLVIVSIVQHFLLMYLPIEIKNASLVASSQDGIYWLILILGGYISAEPVLEKLKIGGVKSVNVENVKDQNITGETVTIQKKDENLQ